MAVYKDGNKWRVIYRYTNFKGERKQTQKRGFATKREAVAWEREVMLKSEAKLDMTFASFFEIYEADKKQRVKENTWESKRHVICTNYSRSAAPSSTALSGSHNLNHLRRNLLSEPHIMLHDQHGRMIGQQQLLNLHSGKYINVV